VIEVASSDGPTDHRSDIFEGSAGGDWRRLGVDHSGYISAVQVPEWDMTDHGENILPQSALNLLGRTISSNAPQVSLSQRRD
jgi:hypothetical protein